MKASKRFVAPPGRVECGNLCDDAMCARSVEADQLIDAGVNLDIFEQEQKLPDGLVVPDPKHEGTRADVRCASSR